MSLMPPCLLPNYPSFCGLEHQALKPIKSFNCCFLLLRTTWSLPCRTSFLHFVLWWTHGVSSIIAHPHWTNCIMSDLYDGYFQTDETVRKHLPRIKVELILIQRGISVVSEYFLSNHWFVLVAIKIPTFLSSWSLPSTPSTENLLRWVEEILKRKSYENRKTKMKDKKTHKTALTGDKRSWGEKINDHSANSDSTSHSLESWWKQVLSLLS